MPKTTTTTERKTKSKKPKDQAQEAAPAKPRKVKAQADDASGEEKPQRAGKDREAFLELPPLDKIEQVRAGTHLADVLLLTARPKGATAVELDAAIVTTAKSVKHYGIWALRYALHKFKGYGFKTETHEGKPNTYHLDIPIPLDQCIKVTQPRVSKRAAAAQAAETAQPALAEATTPRKTKKTKKTKKTAKKSKGKK